VIADIAVIARDRKSENLPRINANGRGSGKADSPKVAEKSRVRRRWERRNLSWIRKIGWSG